MARAAPGVSMETSTAKWTGATATADTGQYDFVVAEMNLKAQWKCMQVELGAPCVAATGMILMHRSFVTSCN